MIKRLMHLLGHLAGGVLGAFGVGAQVGNILVCVSVLLAGPAFIVDLLTR
jgi:hypothetical protein